jgi:hypothetical protein
VGWPRLVPPIRRCHLAKYRCADNACIIAILQFRIYALYNRSRRVLVAMFGMYLAAVLSAAPLEALVLKSYNGPSISVRSFLRPVRLITHVASYPCSAVLYESQPSTSSALGPPYPNSNRRVRLGTFSLCTSGYNQKHKPHSTPTTTVERTVADGGIAPRQPILLFSVRANHRPHLTSPPPNIVSSGASVSITWLVIAISNVVGS